MTTLKKVKNPMKGVYRRLSKAGATASYVRKVALPPWWNDEIAESPSGFAEALVTLSRNLQLDLGSLHDEGNDEVRFREQGNPKFKMREGTSVDAIRWARQISERVAQLAALAATSPIRPLPSSPTEVRNRILAERGSVDLEGLLDFSWSLGIPVVSSQFPPNTRKMDGLCAIVQGRPVIVLSRRQKAHPWLAFILAHELGHLCRGHLSGASFLIDDEKLVGASARKGQPEDQEEVEANSFAVAVLHGLNERHYSFIPRDKWNPAYLAAVARNLGERYHVDPGAIVLHYGRSMDDFVVANVAMSRLQPDGTPDAPDLVRKQMRAKLDWEQLTEDSREFLARVTEVEIDC